jgi:hypothetical protein
MKETVSQFTGTPMNERECYARALEHLQAANNCFRGLAQLRGDMSWLKVVRVLDQVIDNVRKLMTRGGSRLLWLPNRER